MIVSEWIQRLQNEFKPDQHICIHLWQTADLMGTAKELDIELTDEEANNIVEDMERHIDSELGVTWTTVQCAIEDRG